MGQSYTSSSLDLFVIGYSIARSHASCLWDVVVYADHEIEMLDKGLKYTLDKEEKERRSSLAVGQNSAPPKKEAREVGL